MANNAWSNDGFLTLTVGTPGGKRIVLINIANGDALDIYAADGTLVFAIDGNGTASAYSDPQPGIVARLAAGFTTYWDTSATGTAGGSQEGTVGTTGFSLGNPFILEIASPAYGVNRQVSELQVCGGNNAQAFKGVLNGVQYDSANNLRLGQMVQNDNFLSDGAQPFQVHSAVYTLVTNGSGDGGPTAHNCGFTPKVGNGNAHETTFNQNGTQLIIWNNLLDATSFSYRVLLGNGTPFNGTCHFGITFWG